MFFFNSFLSIFLMFNFNFADSNATAEDYKVIIHEDHADFSFEGEPVAVFNKNNKTVNISPSDIELMAMVVYGESGGEPYEGKVAVASVILNRVMSNKFPSTVSGVIRQKGAFSCVRNGYINVKPTKSCYKAVSDALQGADPTNNSLFFYNPEIATCQWMKSVTKNNLIEIGNHVFFISK